jgi:hypothetical protein
MFRHQTQRLAQAVIRTNTEHVMALLVEDLLSGFHATSSAMFQAYLSVQSAFRHPGQAIRLPRQSFQPMVAKLTEVHQLHRELESREQVIGELKLASLILKNPSAPRRTCTGSGERGGTGATEPRSNTAMGMHPDAMIAFRS